MADKLKHILRSYEELVPQKRDTLCVWGTNSRETVQAFGDKGLRSYGHSFSALHEKDHGLRFMFGYVVGELEWVGQNHVYPTLRKLSACHTESIWFLIDRYRNPNARPPEYWGFQFSRVFPRFKMSSENNHYVIQAYTDKRWTEQ